MPQSAFAAIVEFGASAGWSATTTSVVATTAYVATAAAIVVGPTLVARNQQAKAAQGLKNRGILISSRDPTASHKIIYGQVRTGGTIFFLSTTGSDNHTAHCLVTLAAHECNAIRKVYLNDESFTFTDPTNDDAIVAWDNKAYVKSHRGYSGQAAESELVSALPGEWTSDDKVTGHAYLYGRFQWNSDAFPTGFPNITAIVDGRKVYDPRDEEQDANDSSTWVYSNNPALCILDYLRDPIYGLGAAEEEIDYDSFIAAANTCDESYGGGARYTINGQIDTSLAPRDILEQMLTSCVGQLIPAGGVWRLLVGAARETTAVVSLDHVIGPLSPQCGDSLRDTCNGVKGLYVSPENQWQPTDFVPIQSIVSATQLVAGSLATITTVGTTDFTAIGAASNTVGVTFEATGAGTGTGYVDVYLGQDGGFRRWRDIELPFTTNEPEAQRLAHIELRKARQDITLPLRLDLVGLALTVGDVVALPFARYGWDAIGDDGKLFEVKSWKFGYEDTEQGPTPYTELVLREWTDTFFDEVADTAVDPAPNTTLPDPRNVETPTGLTLGSESVQDPETSAWVPRLFVEWDDPAGQFVASGGRTRIEYKTHAASTWIEWRAIRGDQTSTIITDTIFGEVYDVRVRFENILGYAGSWADSLTAHSSGYEVTHDDVDPDPPTSLTVIAGDSSSIRPPPITPGGDLYYVLTVNFTPPPQRDIDYYQFVLTSTDTDGAAEVVVVDDLYATCLGNARQFFRYRGSNSGPQYLRGRAIDYAGNASAWSRCSAGDVSSYLKQPLNSATLIGMTNVTATTIKATSARRYKKRIRTISQPVKLVRKLRGVWYDHSKKSRTPTVKNDIGLIAEEVDRVLPALVGRDDKGRIDSLSYGNLAGLLVEAVKELDRRTQPRRRKQRNRS